MPIPCIYCGMCANFCPHNCLELVETGSQGGK
jgi:formate hydrogenlyase subunit 6/NADH:ubiquinone oxidoreductase subunit I